MQEPGPEAKALARRAGAWDVVMTLLDTRFPAGIMPAWSLEKEVDGKLTLQFESLGFVGFGSEVEGRMTRSNYVITRDGDDHELARGTGRRPMAAAESGWRSSMSTRGGWPVASTAGVDDLWF
jgi:hypothetical protein